MAGHRSKLPRLTATEWVRIAVGAISIAALAIVLGLTMAHPPITRQQAIQVALRYGSEQSYPRVQAKYMRYSDLVNDTSGGFMAPGADSRNDFIWVVAVSGHYAISPLGRMTWGLAVIKDEAWSATSPVFEGGIEGDWPPFFDNLPDLTPVTPSAAS